MWSYYRKALGWMSTWGYEEWLAAGVLVVVMGYFCMKGFGSRGSY